MSLCIDAMGMVINFRNQIHNMHLPKYILTYLCIFSISKQSSSYESMQVSLKIYSIQCTKWNLIFNSCIFNLPSTIPSGYVLIITFAIGHDCALIFFFWKINQFEVSTKVVKFKYVNTLQLYWNKNIELYPMKCNELQVFTVKINTWKLKSAKMALLLSRSINIHLQYFIVYIYSLGLNSGILVLKAFMKFHLKCNFRKHLNLKCMRFKATIWNNYLPIQNGVNRKKKKTYLLKRWQVHFSFCFG